VTSPPTAPDRHVIIDEECRRHSFQMFSLLSRYGRHSVGGASVDGSISHLAVAQAKCRHAPIASPEVSNVDMTSLSGRTDGEVMTSLNDVGFGREELTLPLWRWETGGEGQRPSSSTTEGSDNHGAIENRGDTTEYERECNVNCKGGLGNVQGEDCAPVDEHCLVSEVRDIDQVNNKNGTRTAFIYRLFIC